MKAKLYIDKREPLISVWPEPLSDGSEAWNLYFRGCSDGIPCISEQKADEAFAVIAEALRLATNENVLVL